MIISLDYFHYLPCNILGCMCSKTDLSCLSNRDGICVALLRRILSYLMWLCAWRGCIIKLCQLLHTDPGKAGVLIPLLLCSLWCANNWVCHKGRIRLFVHYNLCRHITITMTCLNHRIYQILASYILSGVCLRWNSLSQLSCMQYLGLWVFVLSIPHLTVWKYL